MTPFCCGVQDVMNSCRSQWSRQAWRNRRLCKVTPSSLRKSDTSFEKTSVPAPDREEGKQATTT